MAVISNKTIYISLDSILDTRLGTMIQINTEFAYAVTSKPSYYSREEDSFEDHEFGKLSKEIYDNVYAKHKNDIVRKSMMTKLHVFLRELCGGLLDSAVHSPFLTGVNIEINTHPYVFTELEINNIVRAVAMQLGGQINVSAINLSDKELTCSHVKENYAAMIMYKYGDWLNMHHRDLQKKILKEVILYVPRLNYVRPINDEERKLFADRGLDEYEVMSMVLCEFINIQHLPIKLFSADTPSNA